MSGKATSFRSLLTRGTVGKNKDAGRHLHHLGDLGSTGGAEGRRGEVGIEIRVKVSHMKLTYGKVL